jgi:uncharacterized membrane protein
MSVIALALGSALAWGCADFLGGLLTRRVAVVIVTVLSQGAGFVALLCWLAADGFHLDARAFGIGALSGLGGGIGLAAYYKALAVGTMSIVAPLAACGAVIPFGLSLATGERPSGLALGGAVVALGGAVLASVEGTAPTTRGAAAACCSRSWPRSRSASSSTSSAWRDSMAKRCRRSSARA